MLQVMGKKPGCFVMGDVDIEKRMVNDDVINDGQKQ